MVENLLGFLDDCTTVSLARQSSDLLCIGGCNRRTEFRQSLKRTVYLREIRLRSNIAGVCRKSRTEPRTSKGSRPGYKMTTCQNRFNDTFLSAGDSSGPIHEFRSKTGKKPSQSLAIRPSFDLSVTRRARIEYIVYYISC
jgi:hypothetical protein